MRLLSLFLLCAGLICAEGCAHKAKFDDPQLEIAQEEDNYYGQKRVIVFSPRDATLDQYKEWATKIRNYEAAEQPVQINFYPSDTHGKDMRDLLCEYSQKEKIIWVRRQTPGFGVPFE